MKTRRFLLSAITTAIMAVAIGQRAMAQTLQVHQANGATTDLVLGTETTVKFLDECVRIASTSQTRDFAKADVLRFTYTILRHDVNGDGKVDVADIASVIDAMSGSGSSVGAGNGVGAGPVPARTEADVNGDGVVDVADIASVIDKMSELARRANMPRKAEAANGNIGEAFYIYRNDGQFNAFFREEIDSIGFSHFDADSLHYHKIASQVVYTSDSTYFIPLVAIDSVNFVTPPTVYKEDVTRLEYNLLDYIIGADGLTLKLKPETPTMIIPMKGDKLVLLEGCEALPYGFSGIVSSVQFGSSSIDVVCEQAYLEDLFNSFCSVTTVYGANADDEDATRVLPVSGSRRVVYSPDDFVFSLGPYKVNRSYEVSQGIAFDGDLALTGGASYSVEVQPTFRIHTFLILGEGQGTYFNYSITGNLRVTSQTSLYGGLSYNHDFDGLIASFPIPQTANMVNFYINPGLFVRADATITSSITSTQNYTFGSVFDFSSKGLNSVKPSIGGRLASSSVDMSGSLDGSLAGGAYLEIGFNLLSREIAKVCVRGEMGARFSGSFVLRNSDVENASKETKLYERMKASEVELGTFVNFSLQASVAHTGNGLTWELSQPIHRWKLVPEFANTKLTQTSGSKTSLDAYTEMSGDCLFPVGVGYKLLDSNKNEVGNYNAGTNYTNKAGKMEHTFSGLDESKLYDYKVYPKVRIFGFDVLASPEAKLKGETSCPDENHPHWIDLGIGTQWRCCNEGASRPEEYGGYYTFGQVASAPTLEQIKALVNNCSYTWTTQNGVNGGKFTGPNGGTIFLPAAGGVSGGELDGVGSCGFSWSSTPYDEDSAYYLDFRSGYADWYHYWYGYWGDANLSRLTVRPVR